MNSYCFEWLTKNPRYSLEIIPLERKEGLFLDFPGGVRIT